MARVARRRSRATSESGAELIEFALVFPMLLLVVFGIMDFGLLFQQYEVVTNAAREGARVAVLPGYSAADAEARATQYLDASLLGTGTATATVGAPQQLTVGSNCLTVIPVTVSFDHEYIFLGPIAGYFGSSFGTRTLTATASMRVETGATTCP